MEGGVSHVKVCVVCNLIFLSYFANCESLFLFHPVCAVRKVPFQYNAFKVRD